MFRNRDSIHSAEYPLVQEMTTVLREWGIMWKHLYLVRLCMFAYELLDCLIPFQRMLR